MSLFEKKHLVSLSDFQNLHSPDHFLTQHTFFSHDTHSEITARAETSNMEEKSKLVTTEASGQGAQTHLNKNQEKSDLTIDKRRCLHE